MGFRQGAFATVWKINPKSNVRTDVQLSISRKNKQTGNYETDFSGFVAFIGTAAANKAMSLKRQDRIKLGDTDVSNTYDHEKKVTYVNYKVFSFEIQQDTNPDRSTATPQNSPATIDEGVTEELLPF